MPRATAERGLVDPLIDTEGLIEIAAVFPDLTARVQARLDHRAAGFERDIRGPWMPCAHCNQDVPTRAVAIHGTAHWLCLKRWHVLSAADLTPFAASPDQLPVWTATGTPETEPERMNP